MACSLRVFVAYVAAVEVFSTMDLCVSWIGQLDLELSAMLVYTSAELLDSACLE